MFVCLFVIFPNENDIIKHDYYYHCHNQKHCRQEKAKIWIHYKPSLFQHIGTTSSLKGKVQKLKDKQFGKMPAFYPHKNPPATVKTPINAYKTYTIERAYAGQTFFWGLLPQPGDYIEFVFNEPYNLRRYVHTSTWYSVWWMNAKTKKFAMALIQFHISICECCFFWQLNYK